MKNLNNKTIWITGASDGIGKELAIQLSQLGAKIILTARNTAKLNQVLNSLKGQGHLVFPMDLLNVEQIPQKVEQLLNQIEYIDILINNAGISQRSLAANTSIEVDRKLMEINYFAKVSLTKSILPSMIERKV